MAAEKPGGGKNWCRGGITKLGTIFGGGKKEKGGGGLGNGVVGKKKAQT